MRGGLSLSRITVADNTDQDDGSLGGRNHEAMLCRQETVLNGLEESL